MARRKVKPTREPFTILDGARRETFFERHTAAILVAFFIVCCLLATWIEGF